MVRSVAENTALAKVAVASALPRLDAGRKLQARKHIPRKQLMPTGTALVGRLFL
jgi:hypothetical protein